MQVERRIRRDVQVMEMVETPLDTNWRQHIWFPLFPKEKGTQREVFLADPDGLELKHDQHGN
jgi:hypothetical protein